MSILKKLKSIGSKITILYVEDDKKLLKSFSTYLGLIFSKVDTAADGEEGLDKFVQNDYDIVITDIQMPNLNGLDMIETIRKRVPKQEILVATAFSDATYAIKAIELDVSGYITKPFDFRKINATLYKIVNKINIFNENQNYKTRLEEMVKIRTEKNLLLEREKIDNYEKTLLSLIELVERRDTYTGGHSQRVAKYSKMIAQEMGFSKKECELVYRAGILHDIGKIETPDAVLLNPGKLNTLQFSIIKEHVVASTELLSKIPMYKKLSDIVAQHHERYDGKGYPKGLKKDKIAPLARILIVADAFDAMTTNRIYKPKMSLSNALEELGRFSGTQFHKRVVEHAINIFKNIKLDENIAQLPSTNMENKRFAFFFEDQLTGVFNKTYLELILIQNKNIDKIWYINTIFIHNFGKYNTKYGWEAGDIFLNKVAQILRESFPNHMIFRFQGDDFVIISENHTKINLHIFDKLLLESKHMVSIGYKEYNSKSKEIHSLSDLINLL